MQPWGCIQRFVFSPSGILGFTQDQPQPSWFSWLLRPKACFTSVHPTGVTYLVLVMVLLDSLKTRRSFRRPVLLQFVGAIGCGAIALLTLAVIQIPAIAQGFGSENLDNPTNDSENEVNSVFDLIHQQNFSNPRTPQEIQEDRRNNIQSAADEFRQRQQEALSQQQGSQELPSDAPVAQPISGTEGDLAP